MGGMTNDIVVNLLVSAVSTYNTGGLMSRPRQFEYIKEAVMYSQGTALRERRQEVDGR
jgi:hypothetical protein